MSKVKVFKKIPGGIWMVDFIENTLKGFQAAVGGYIEIVTLFSDLTIVCNEEGRLMDLEPCCNLCGVDFVGPVVVVSYNDKGDFVDVRMSFDRFLRFFT